jgi:hypothetical protein
MIDATLENVRQVDPSTPMWAGNNSSETMRACAASAQIVQEPHRT